MRVVFQGSNTVNQQLKMWNRSFRARHVSNSNIWRCENEAFVRGGGHPSKFEFKLWKWSLNWQFHCAANSRMIPVLTSVFRNRLLDKLSPHIIRDTLCPATYIIVCIRQLSKPKLSCETSFKFQQLTNSWRCEMKLLCETSFKFQLLKMWNRSFRAGHVSNSNS